MDAERFDTLSKRVASPATRRATLGALVASAIGLRHVPALAQEAQGQVCTLAFVATVRMGPSQGQKVTSGSTQPGQLQGQLRFSLTKSGKLDQATLTLPDGTTQPVVGQATGHALQLRIAFDGNTALVAMGVGEREIAECAGAIDGTTAGPQAGDLGEWHARAQGLTGGAGTAGGAATAVGGATNRGQDGGGRGGGRGGESSATSNVREGQGESSRAQESSNGQESTKEPKHAKGKDRQTTSTEATAQTREQTSASTPTPAAAQSAQALDCGVDSAACNGVCVDVLFDSNNCGKCGTQCAPDEACVAGNCQPSAALTVPPGQEAGCVADMALCNGVCIDVMGDRANCGLCGFQCAEGEVCIAGTCHPPADLAVPPGQALECGVDSAACNGVCVDVLFDPSNCGGCGIQCAPDQACVAGNCQPSAAQSAQTLECGADSAACNGVCVDVLFDSNNCGMCGVQCAPDEACVAGNCQPSAALTVPPGQEVGCGVDMALCNGVCVDVLGDPNNCGFCGNACPAGTACVGGSCV
jgi:hypothetical protein